MAQDWITSRFRVAEAKQRYIAFGVMAGVRTDGSIVWPAYVMGHEFGHDYQGADKDHPAWQLDTRNMMSDDPQFRVAPNSSEYYAYHFAEQVRLEILQNSGVDIGTQKNYWDGGTPSGTYMGLLPPTK